MAYSLKDEHLMRKDSEIFKGLKESNLTENQKDVVRERAGTLEAFEKRAEANRKWVESVQDRRDVTEKLVGCRSCKERWMNPHADYTQSEIAPFIDGKKI